MGGSSVGVQDVNSNSLVSAREAIVTPIRDGFRMFQSTPVAVLPQIGLVGTDVAPVATMAYPNREALNFKNPLLHLLDRRHVWEYDTGTSTWALQTVQVRGRRCPELGYGRRTMISTGWRDRSRVACRPISG
jgi:hypothetical protein